MVYTPGQDVEATDYNDLAYETGLPPVVLPTVAKVGDIFGTGFGDYGYGGNSLNVGVADLPTITSGDIIQSDTDILDDGFPPGDPDEWVNLRNAFADCATHQGIVLSDALPVVGDLEDGDVVSANSGGNFDNLDSVQNNLDLANNKDLVAGESFTIANIPSVTHSRVTPWTAFIQHIFTVDFGSEDNARHYFNTGGEIRISASRAGGAASIQNANWTALLIAAGTYTLSTYASYNALTGSYATVFGPHIGGGVYGSNNWTIQARRENFTGALGGNGSVIRFKSDFVDGHTNIFFDTVDGTFTSTIDEKRSTGIFPRPTPSYTTITALTAGS